MKSDKRIFLAFLLNLSFSALELAGGLLTGSISILSDALHDFADALSLGVSRNLEKKSQRNPDEKNTYGYLRYSVLGAFFISGMLTVGSLWMIYQAICRLWNPLPVSYHGMFILAVVGIVVNLVGAILTKPENSLHQKAVHLHLMEDVLGWVAVLAGSLLIKWTGWLWIDPVLSILVAIFVLHHAIVQLCLALDIFLEKTPPAISLQEVKTELFKLTGILEIHHLHLWSIDENHAAATLHAVTENTDFQAVKRQIREIFNEYGIHHITVELELPGEECGNKKCIMLPAHKHCCHHH